MTIQGSKIAVDQLVVGMYVLRLDRPWIETPFPVQGFVVRRLSDIDQLKRYCREVYVDEHRSIAPVSTVKPAKKVLLGTAVSPVLGKSHELAAEVRSMQPLFHSYSELLAPLNLQIVHNDWSALKSVRRIAAGMVESVLRNPDALVWLANTGISDQGVVAHTVRSAIWAAVFGRHLGLSAASLHILVQAVLLMDVGKVALPVRLSSDAQPTVVEQSLVKKHVALGMSALAKCSGVDPMIIQVVAQHHERYDGSGYPGGLSGKAILPMAKIAGITDYYEQMLYPDQDRPCGSAEVINRLCAVRHHAFQSSLVDEFIEAMGLYPSGSRVQLSNRQFGVVLEPNPGQRYRPKIAVLPQTGNMRFEKPVFLDLSKVFHDEQGHPLKIHSSVGACNFSAEDGLALLGLLDTVRNPHGLVAIQRMAKN